MTIRLEDQQARQAALDGARSCIVQAPAGSGKTELLIQRFLVLLAQVAAPEEIVAITFTRKAAAEMRGRILAALDAAAGDAPAEPHRQHTWQLAKAALERDAAQGWQLRENPARLRVLTIDAFNLSLVRRLPWLSRLGGAPATVDDARPLFQRAARETLALLETEGAPGASAARLLQHLDNQVERSEGLLSALLARRDQWQRHLLVDGSKPVRAELEAAWAAVVTATLQQVANALAPFAGEVAACADYAARTLKPARPDANIVACAGLKTLPTADPAALGQWRGIAELLLTGGGTWRSPRGLNKTNGFPSDTAPQKAAKKRMADLVEELAQDSRAAAIPDLLPELPDATFTDAEWEVIAALLALLPEAVERLRETFRRGGVADFIEIAMAAHAALASRGEGDALRHLLVDEFQDTSISQFRLLQRLVAGWKPEDGHTLFLVGDPMQSIYRFREAEVGLFLRAWTDGIAPVALQPLTLRSNFRSDAGIVAWVNAAFAQVFPSQADVATGAVPYSEASAVRPAAIGTPVTVHSFVVAQEHKEWGALQEAESVAEIAWQARHDGPAASIAILVRARTHLAHILPALRAVGLPYRAVEIEALAEQPVVVDLVALTRALLYPADRIAWLAVLRGPLCGLTLADLLHLAGAAPGAALWERMQSTEVVAALSGEGRPRLERVRVALERALTERARFTLRTWVEGTWLTLGGPVGLTDLELTHARAYFGVLEELEAGGTEPTPEELTRHLEGLFADPNPDPTAVQVMTIHKAKGLEFDTVILPGLGRRSGWDMPPLLRWQEVSGSAGGLLLSPIGEVGMDHNPNFRYLGWAEKQRTAQELRRLAYVAATRAKQHLHLLGVALMTDKGLRPPDARSLLGVLWPALEMDFTRAPVSRPEAVPVEREAASAPLRRLPLDWAAPPPPPDARVAALPVEEAEPRAAIEYSWVGFTARRVGIVVHRQLLRISRDGVEAWPIPRVDAQGPLIRQQLAQAGVPDAELDAATARCLAALRATVTDAKGRWVLEAHTEGRAEFDVTAVLDGEIRRLRVDRTFVDADGRRWIVDYKTSTHQGAGLEHFLEEEVKRYREAMERYATGMRALEPQRPVTLALYFPLVAGGWREWAFEG